jgi:hypothetical protein
MHPLKPGDLLDFTASEVAALIQHINALAESTWHQTDL